MATKTRVTLEQFLAMPETEPPSELIDGEVIQKVAPSLAHGYMVSFLIEALGPYLRRTGEGRIVTEVRHLSRPDERVFLPDVNVTRIDRLPRRRDEVLHGVVQAIPDFAIEVLSPGTPSGRTLERADFYMRAGTQLLWLVDPETETVTAYRPREAPTLHRAPAKIDALPVLSAFELDLAALFAVLHEGEE